MTLREADREGAAAGPRLVRAVGSLRGEIRVPSDKSVAHRALLFNAMASGSAEVALRRPGADVLSTVRVLHDLGTVAGVEARDGSVRVTIRGGGEPGATQLPAGGGERLDCGNSGTTMRLLCGALAGRLSTAVGGSGATSTGLVGDPSLSSRPMERVAVPLRVMGAEVVTTGGHAPLRVRGNRPLRAMRHDLPVASAQVLGAITLAALAADGITTIETPAETRDHTERLLAWLGAPVHRDGTRTTVNGPAGLRAGSLSVPGDLSSAAAWLVAATLHPDAELRLPGVSLNPSRTAIVDVLREMGADIEVESGELAGGRSPSSPEPEGDIVVRSVADLRAISLGGSRVASLIDELPLIAVTMAAANGVSELRDAAELRVKESDRIAQVVWHLMAMGVRAEELSDGWRITGSRRPRPVPVAPVITTRGDHRIAIAFAVAALAGVGVDASIDDPACIDVSYPGFWDDLESISGAVTAGAGAAR
ncbi:MAG: 3-phosphoshikimate 1-carboxyvinyltransferase [Chloroflexota bacterium]|nr:3-phosphoshikimate 1-carboxyvinyltransferase [Chloroflexota bacterium]